MAEAGHTSIAIVGTRTVDRADPIHEVLALLLKANGPFTLVSGAADGVDSIAAKWARQRGLKVEEYPADWNQGKSAGPRRNKLIVEAADVIVAFWDGVSTGTLDTIKKSRAAKKPLKVYLL